MTLQVDPVVAADLRLLSEVAGRLARHLEDGLAVRAEGEPHAGVKLQEASELGALLDSTQLAGLLRVNLRTLRRWRHEGRVPRPLKGKGPLRWDRRAVMAWIEGRRA